jgi:hypothetical protein
VYDFPAAIVLRTRSLARFALLAGLVLATGAAAGAQDAPSPDDLLAKNRVASGAEHRPQAEIEHWAVQRGAVDASLQTVRNGSDTKSVTVAGPFTTARGESGGQRWHQNENGETILDEPEPSQAEVTVSQTVEHVSQPIAAWSLTTTYQSGHVVRNYYAAASYLLVRQETTAAQSTAYTDYDDFRIDAAGRTRPWHFHGEDGAGNVFDDRLTLDDVAPQIGAEALGIPRDRRVLVEFPAGQTTVRLPARIEGNRVYVRVEIAGRGLDFELDSGVGSIELNAGVANELGLAGYGQSARPGAQTFATTRVIAPLVTIGPLVMRDVVLHTDPFASSEGRTRVVGLLGFDFLDAVALRLDYEHGTVDAQAPTAFVADPGAEPLPIRLNSQVPVARLDIGGARGDDFILDTGAAYGLILFPRFEDAHPELFAAVEARPPRRGEVTYGNAVGGQIALRPIDVPGVTLAKWRFASLRGDLALDPSPLGRDTDDGLIGADILRLFMTTFDYAHERVWLAPNSNFPGGPGR